MKDHVALIIKKDGKILFIRRSKMKKILPNIWAFPTGTVESNEKMEDTAKREAKEELDIDINVEKILGAKELPEFGDKLHFIICDIKSGEPKIKDSKEINSVKWLTFEDFFNKYEDWQIGHGLAYLRKNPGLLTFI